VPVNIIARSIIMTKQASGNVQIVIQSSSDGLNPNGDINFACVIASADFTSFNTTVNGGATGATLTKTYAENFASGDYPGQYAGGI
jgi:hypothetical protein